MKTPKGEVIVLDIAGNTARLMCDAPQAAGALEALGFLAESDHLTRKIIDDADRQTLAGNLIRMNVLFASGRDWSPSELVDFYKEQGLISQGYRTVTWTGPESYFILQKD